MPEEAGDSPAVVFIQDFHFARVDRERFEVTRYGKGTMVRPFPTSIDFAVYGAAADSPQSAENE
jgi:hypothetical protein